MEARGDRESVGHAAGVHASAWETTPVSSLKGVGPRVAERLARLGIRSLQDLLFHLPLRYQDRTHVVPIGALQPGTEAVVEGVVELSEVRFRRRRALLCWLSDGTGALALRFFHFTAAQQAGLARGVRLRCYGTVRVGPTSLEMVHPEHQRVGTDEPPPDAGHLTPIYPTTEGVHQLVLRALTDQVLERLQREEEALTEWLPAPVLRQFRLPSLSAALRYVHRPPGGAPLQALEQGAHPAQQRLAFEELLAHHLSLRRLRENLRSHPAPRIPDQGALAQRLRAALPFQLTGAQRRVLAQIERDLAGPMPMLRLVQGDVGSGKTVVTAFAALHAVEAGYQVAVMAPTELLAEQHYRSFRIWLEPLGTQVGWLAGSLKGTARRRMLEAIAGAGVAVAIGTHALFQAEVRFARLGLVVIDEQHRFGVHQRLALRDKGAGTDGLVPHQLILTATPIPRTLAMAAYADLDSSVIDELPPGRTPVKTVVVPDGRRDEVMERVRVACRGGRQAYWVCTLIDESESLQAQAAADTASQLQQALPEVTVGLVHGRMPGAEKQRVMSAFQAGEIRLLVATTVIEVGVDVPNASLMIIDNAERLGLAQLHQLRGRVGRGAAESSCVLLYHGNLSEAARVRLQALRETNDGFVIAQRDLDLRGPGEVLGTRQAGAPQLHIADLLRDRHLLDSVQQAGELLLHDHPTHVAPLIRRWLGDAVRFGEA